MGHYVTRTLEVPFEDALRTVSDALAREGFGVLSQIDLKKKLKQKLGVEFREYRVLRACNPPSLPQGMLLESDIGSALPCNVVIQETSHGRVKVSVTDPAIGMTDDVRLGPLADDLRVRLRAVVVGL